MSSKNFDKKIQLDTKMHNIEIIGVPSSVSPRDPKVRRNFSYDEDGVEEAGMILDEEEEEEQNVYYIDHENIMQINSPLNG